MELHRAELEVVLRDENDNIGYGHAPVELDDVVRWLDEEEQLAPSAMADVLAMNQLVDFVRTPEWSVSMLEDIAEIVQKARPDVFKKDGWSYDADDPRAWKSH